MDYADLSAWCGMVAPKLFTFDFTALPRWYGEQLLDRSPRLSEEQICDVLVDVFDLPDDLVPRRFAKYRMPAPGETHHTHPAAHRPRIEQIAADVGPGRTRVCPILHAYLPPDEWREMIRVARACDIDGVWVQMYGYLTEQKLDILAEQWHEPEPDRRDGGVAPG